MFLDSIIFILFLLLQPSVPTGNAGSSVDDGYSLSESDVNYLKNLRNSMDQARNLLQLVCEREKMKTNWVCFSVSVFQFSNRKTVEAKQIKISGAVIKIVSVRSMLVS